MVYGFIRYKTTDIVRDCLPSRIFSYCILTLTFGIFLVSFNNKWLSTCRTATTSTNRDKIKAKEFVMIYKNKEFM